MSGRASPFAALTGAEKQIKWLEVQSVRLPYVQGALEGEDAARDDGRDAEGTEYADTYAGVQPSKGANNRRAAQTQIQSQAPTPTPSDPRTFQGAQRAAPEESAPPESNANKEARARQPNAARIDFQTTRHKQYDAVIARMRKAEQQARGYSPIT